MEYRIRVDPPGKELASSGGDDLLSLLHAAGIEVESVCGGIGACGKCRVRILSGKASDPTPEEEDHLSGEELAAGERLACQVYPRGDLSVRIPPSSLASSQRLQLASELALPEPDPAVRCRDLEVEIPTAPGDHGSDLKRVLEAVRAAAPGEEARAADLAGVREIPPLLREEAGRVRAVTRGGELLGILPRRLSPLGLAVDLGSTKVALFLYDLRDGRMLASRGFLNPQIAHGEDIVTRIRFALEGGASRLMRLVVEGINLNLSGLLAEVDRSLNQVYEMVLVGNTAMHHLFLGLPVVQLCMSPYLPAADLPLEVKAGDLGLELNPAAVAYLPPPIAGYVGSDHLAAVAAARLWERPGPCLLLDIGTNTEVALQVDGHIRCCSCASGPAFEGGGLSQGMRAGEGAIERVCIDPATGEPRLAVIGGKEPRGICGSGILGALAAMVDAGVIDASGRMREGLPGVERRGEEPAYYLAPPDASNPAGVAVTQKDVREIQKAKGAIRAGIDALLLEAGVEYGDLSEIVLAGAFGTYIDPAAALRAALLPPLPAQRISQVGNAAGAGACSLLLSLAARIKAEDLASRLEYLELSAYPRLSALFAAGMYLSEEAVQAAKQHFSL